MLVTLSQLSAANLCKFHGTVTMANRREERWTGGPNATVSLLFTFTYRRTKNPVASKSRFCLRFLSSLREFFSTTISTELPTQVSLFLTGLAELRSKEGGCVSTMSQLRGLKLRL